MNQGEAYGCSPCECAPEALSKVGRAFYLIESGVASVIVADCDGQAQLVRGLKIYESVSVTWL